MDIVVHANVLFFASTTGSQKSVAFHLMKAQITFVYNK